MAKSKSKKDSSKKSKTSVSKKLKKTVIKIVKKELKKDVELKYFKYVTDANTTGIINTGSPVITTWNLFYQGVTAGTSDNQLLGNKFRWKGINIKYRLLNGRFTPTGFVKNFDQQVVDLYIISCSIQSNITSLTYSSLINDTSTDGNIFFFNKDVTVHKKKTVTLGAKYVAGITQADIPAQQLTGKMWLKQDKTIEYKDLQSNYDLKGGRYYYLVMLNRSPSAETCNMSFSWQNYFVDA